MSVGTKIRIFHYHVPRLGEIIEINGKWYRVRFKDGRGNSRERWIRLYGLGLAFAIDEGKQLEAMK